MKSEHTYDIVVIGAGHAGCEAALAAARMGFHTAIFTINLENIGQMSCNPAIGGLAKGQLATNEALVERAVTIVQTLGVTVVGPAEVRDRLGLEKRAPA